MGRRSGEIRRRREEREAAASCGCLICRRSDGGFKSKEHVFPECLGNKDIILPPGVVCDRCNNTTLSRLDQTICDFMPIKARRMMLGVDSKSGKIPDTRWVEGTVEHMPSVGGADPILVFRSHDGHEMLREKARHSDGRVEVEWKSSGGRRLTPRYGSELSRALLKSAFECAWLDRGSALFERRYDNIRRAILGAPQDGFVLALKKGNPDRTEVALTYDFVPDGDAMRLWTWVDYFGIVLATDSRLATPVGDVPEDLVSMISFTAADLS
jgi:hypothetical protein